MWASSSTRQTVAAAPYCVDVHLAQRHAAVLDHSRRDDLKVGDLLGGFGATMGLDQPDHNVDALAELWPSRSIAYVFPTPAAERR